MNEIEDRLLIRERYGLYSDAAFQKNAEAWLACWCDTGEWHLFGKALRGKDALRQQWDDTWQLLDRMAFFSEIGPVDIRAGKASVRSYCHEVVSFKDGNLLNVVAQYDDELVKESGRWLFAKRVYNVLIQH